MGSGPCTCLASCRKLPCEQHTCGEGSRYIGYVGGFEVREKSVFELPTIEETLRQQCNGLHTDVGCNLTGINPYDNWALDPCRELIATQHIHHGITSASSANGAFWGLPKKVRVDFLLRHYKGAGMNNLIFNQFFEGEDKKIDNVIDYMKFTFLEKMLTASFDDWYVLALSGVFYLLSTKGLTSAAKFCRAEVTNDISAICDADLDDRPDAEDLHPFRPIQVSQENLDSIYNGEEMFAGIEYFLCTREVDPIPNSGFLHSETRFVDDYYETYAPIYLVPEHKEINKSMPAFQNEVMHSLNIDLPLVMKKYPVQFDIDFVEKQSDAWHVIFVTRMSENTHGQFFKLIFPRYNVQFLSLDVPRKTIRHEIGGHIMYGLDERYIHHGAEWFEPFRHNKQSHLLHSVSLDEI